MDYPAYNLALINRKQTIQVRVYLGSQRVEGPGAVGENQCTEDREREKISLNNSLRIYSKQKLKFKKKRKMLYFVK